jgi:hypothetical protein
MKIRAIENLTLGHLENSVVDPDLDPDSMGSLDPVSGSKKAKMTHKNRKKLITFIF